MENGAHFSSRRYVWSGARGLDLVRIGRQERWGLVDRVSEESGFLKGLLSCDDGYPVLDLVDTLGCDLNADICGHLLDYLCSYDSEWWQGSPSIGALDAADLLGLSRLVQFIVNPYVRYNWVKTTSCREWLVVESSF